MPVTYMVSVNVGAYRFTRTFDLPATALECFDLLAENKSGVIETDWASEPSHRRIDTVTIRTKTNTVGVRIGVYEFLIEFEDQTNALECFGFLSGDPTVVVTDNWATKESAATASMVSIQRVMTAVRVGDPNR
jgi:hypothetical protein